MVNTEAFVKRLEIILDYYNLNASSFADKIGVQRSSLSHLLSGRNKPSLDFILKITAVFPDVDLYWILNGKGEFPKISDLVDQSEIKFEKVIKPNLSTSSKENKISENILIEIKDGFETSLLETIKLENDTIPSKSVPSEIERIVLFYKNGTFKIYNSN